MFPHFLWKAPDDIKTYGGVMQWDGPLPDKRCFRVGRNNKETKKEDEAWEQESKLWWSPQQPDKPKWNFRERAMFYCHVDVEVTIDDCYCITVFARYRSCVARRGRSATRRWRPREAATRSVI